jgi:hypothetical protein
MVEVVGRAVDWMMAVAGIQSTEAGARADFVLFLAGLVTAPVGTIIVAAIVWILVTRPQRRAQEDLRSIERLRLLHDLDDAFQSIVATRCVRLAKGDAIADGSDEGWFALEVILTRGFPWALVRSPGGELPYRWIAGERMVAFGRSGAVVTTASLHKLVYWARRLWRAKESDLVTDHDLYVMWRQILPLSTDGRYSFMEEYFGQGNKEILDPADANDVTPLAYAVRSIILYCLDRKIYEPLAYIGYDLKAGAWMSGARLDKKLAEAFARSSGRLSVPLLARQHPGAAYERGS